MDLQNTGSPDLSSAWTMYFDVSKRLESAPAGVVLISPQGDKIGNVMQMSFPNTSNNEAEYEALLHGMRMEKACGVTRLKIFGDSNLTDRQVMNKCNVVSDNMIAYRDMYNHLKRLFNGCEASHISMSSTEEVDMLANIGSQCLPVPPGVFLEDIKEHSIKPPKAEKSKDAKEKREKRNRGLRLHPKIWKYTSPQSKGQRKS
jgi:ribonuclease HI